MSTISYANLCILLAESTAKQGQATPPTLLPSPLKRLSFVYSASNDQRYIAHKFFTVFWVEKQWKLPLSPSSVGHLQRKNPPWAFENRVAMQSNVSGATNEAGRGWQQSINQIAWWFYSEFFVKLFYLKNCKNCSKEGTDAFFQFEIQYISFSLFLIYSLRNLKNLYLMCSKPLTM
jgi:hypothetical protein